MGRTRKSISAFIYEVEIKMNNSQESWQIEEVYEMITIETCDSSPVLCNKDILSDGQFQVFSQITLKFTHLVLYNILFFRFGRFQNTSLFSRSVLCIKYFGPSVMAGYSAAVIMSHSFAE